MPHFKKITILKKKKNHKTKKNPVFFGHDITTYNHDITTYNHDITITTHIQHTAFSFKSSQTPLLT